MIYFVFGSCGIAFPSERGSAPAKFTLRFVSRITASPCPTVNEKGSNPISVIAMTLVQASLGLKNCQGLMQQFDRVNYKPDQSEKHSAPALGR
jgi:hypothetical protein